MQNFESFVSVFGFFVKSHFNSFYVDKIDQSIRENIIDEDTRDMINNVTEFHTMRHQLCTKIFEYLKNAELLNTLVSARGLEQFDVVPNNSICCICGVKLNARSGILLYVNSSEVTCITVHKRYKQILYNFWYLVHFADEIMVDIRSWLKNDLYTKNISSVIEKIIDHQDQLFIKQGYVKLKNINEYIQSEMPRLPINHGISTVE